MNVDERQTDAVVSGIAAAIGEAARARMLYSLLDGRARTSTELAMVAEVTPSTASVHLHRLKAQRLVKVSAQGKHRYYSLEGAEVARALEALSVLAGGGARAAFVPSTPEPLRAARTCYDHIAGALGVALHDRFFKLGWIAAREAGRDAYEVTSRGTQAFETLGVRLAAAQSSRRRFAYPCVDWSERRPHLAGALGAEVLRVALKRTWLVQELDSRALNVTRSGRREMAARFGVQA
jgi:DNA-binding transcriptional ArsR family regulator